jgi:hypothetical protein
LVKFVFNFLEIVCLCAYQFNNNDLKQIYEFFDKSNNKDNKKIVEKIITNYFTTVCFLCLNDVSLAGDVFNQISFKNGNKEFKHVFCVECNLRNTVFE